MLRHPVTHYSKILQNADYRHYHLEIRKLWRTERYKLLETDLPGPMIQVPDAASFLPMYRSIFQDEIYKFRAETMTPYILDGGANIGLSVLYFKQLYPDAQIVAFEPDPKIYAILKHNIASAELHRVETVNRALWTEETSLWFASEGADAGRVAEDAADAKDCEVKTVRLRDYLDVPVDFLKLDIEGAETGVIEDCHDKLTNVKCTFIEYHSFANRPQTLDTILAILKDNGFRVQMHVENPARQPFLERKLMCGMDLQIDIFGYRA